MEYTQLGTFCGPILIPPYVPGRWPAPPGQGSASPLPAASQVPDKANNTEATITLPNTYSRQASRHVAAACPAEGACPSTSLARPSDLAAEAVDVLRQSVGQSAHDPELASAIVTSLLQHVGGCVYYMHAQLHHALCLTLCM